MIQAPLPALVEGDILQQIADLELNRLSAAEMYALLNKLTTEAAKADQLIKDIRKDIDDTEIALRPLFPWEISRLQDLSVSIDQAEEELESHSEKAAAKLRAESPIFSDEEDDEALERVSPEIKRKAKILFKRIANKTHPDKLKYLHITCIVEQQRRIDIYYLAKEAKINYDVGTLELLMLSIDNVEEQDTATLEEKRILADQLNNLVIRIKSAQIELESLTESARYGCAMCLRQGAVGQAESMFKSMLVTRIDELQKYLDQIQSHLSAFRSDDEL